MRKNLLDVLACPVCKSPLDMTIEQEDAGDVVMGRLYCAQCCQYYPIEDAIPDMLPPSLRD